MQVVAELLCACGTINLSPRTSLAGKSLVCQLQGRQSYKVFTTMADNCFATQQHNTTQHNTTHGSIHHAVTEFNISGYRLSGMLFWQVVAAGPGDMRMYYQSYDPRKQRFVVGWASSPDGFK